MSHACLRSAAIAGGWPTAKRTTTAAVTARQGGGGGGGGGSGGGGGNDGGGASIARGARGTGTVAVSPTSALLQPTIIPCRGMASAGCAGGGKVLTEDNVFVNLRKMEYAVRGPLLMRALEIEKELQKVRRSIRARARARKRLVRVSPGLSSGSPASGARECPEENLEPLRARRSPEDHDHTEARQDARPGWRAQCAPRLPW